MTFEEVVKKYPLHTTYVGDFYCDETFQASSLKDVIDIDHWEFAPFDWSSDSLPFVYYNTDTNQVEGWRFSFFPVAGYINDSDNPDQFQPATYSDDFGWEIVDFNEYIVLLEPENIDPDYEYLTRVEQAAQLFDKEAFDQGLIFCTADAIKNYFGRKEE